MGEYLKICPTCGERSVQFAVVTDDENDETYEIGEYCTAEGCIYELKY